MGDGRRNDKVTDWVRVFMARCSVFSASMLDLTLCAVITGLRTTFFVARRMQYVEFSPDGMCFVVI